MGWLAVGKLVVGREGEGDNVHCIPGWTGILGMKWNGMGWYRLGRCLSGENG